MKQGSLEDLNWDDTTSVPASKGNRKTGGALAGLVSVAVGLTAFALLSNNMLPWQYRNDTPLSQPTAEANKVIPTVVAKDSPAATLVSKLMTEMPPALEGMNGAAAGPDAAQTLPGLRNCPGITPIAPVVSGIKAWAGGNWIKPSGATVTVNVYPAGIGSDALTQLTTSQCEWLGTTKRGNRIDGTVRNGNETTSFVSWRNGDVITTVTATNRAIPEQFIKDMITKMEQSLTPVCANPKETEDTSTRNPYYNVEEFTGLITQEQVKAVAPIPAYKAQPQSQPLSDVQLPQQPEFPFYPKALPTPVPKPTPPAVPGYPATEETIYYRVPDDIGPGCGWAFTGMVKPAYDQSKVDAKKATMTKDAQSRMKTALDEYQKKVTEWEKSWGTYKTAEQSYIEYVGKVYEVDVKWTEQREAQNRYKTELAAYNEAVNDYNDFNSRKAAAQKQYDLDVQTCNQYSTATATPSPTMVTPRPTTTTTTVTPTPTPGANPTAPPTPYETTVTVTPTPYPTTIYVQPSAPIQCPARRPTILDQNAPYVPTKPTPPPDPRPEGER